MERYNDEYEMNFNLLLVGEPGVGKTRLCATATMHESTRDVLWLDVDGGLLTLRDMELEHPPLVEKIESIDQLEEIHWHLKKRDEGYEEIRTVVIDNGTELVPMDLEAVVRRKAAKEKKEKGGKTRRFGVDDVWLDDRGETGRRLARIFRWYRDLPINTIITCHSREIFKKMADNTEGPLEDTLPEFPRGLRRQVCGFQDYVWYMWIKDEERFLLTQRRPKHFAKTRGEKAQKIIGSSLRVPMDRPFIPEIVHSLKVGEPLHKDYSIEVRNGE